MLTLAGIPCVVLPATPCRGGCGRAVTLVALPGAVCGPLDGVCFACGPAVPVAAERREAA